MQLDELPHKEYFQPIYLIQKYLLQIFFGISIIIFALVAYFATASNQLKPKTTLGAMSSSLPHVVQSATPTTSSGTLYVDVAGAVTNPGVYRLAAGSRVQDAIIQAGGFREDIIDKNFVARELNLAAKLTDGQKIYILHQGEDRTKVQTVLGAITSSSGNGQTTGGKVNLNTASSSQLEALSGVGTVTAKKIIDNRPYTSLQDLLVKKVIGQSVYTKIQNDVTVE